MQENGATGKIALKEKSVMPKDKQSPEDNTTTEYYNAYHYYSNLLRTWLVAYGVGGPILFLSNEALWKRLASDGTSLGFLFLGGVALQVIVAALNKTVMWACYFGELNEKRRQTGGQLGRYRHRVRDQDAAVPDIPVFYSRSV